jgi:hypothetical protein
MLERRIPEIIKQNRETDYSATKQEFLKRGLDKKYVTKKEGKSRQIAYVKEFIVKEFQSFG